MTAPTILLVAPFPPLADSGGGIAIFGDLCELKQRGVTIDIICFRANRSPEALRQLKPFCRHLILVDGPPTRSIRVPVEMILLQLPLVVARHNSAQMKQAINMQLAAEAYDVVLVEFSFMFQYFLSPDLAWDSSPKPLLVLDHLVVTPKVYQYFSDVAPNPIVKWSRNYEIQRLKAYLRAALSTADQHLFVGQEDLVYIRQEFPEINSDKLLYRPTGLILERYPVADPAQTEPNTIGFFGAFNWAANVDAVHYFVRDILPLIQLRQPQVRFVLAGRSAPDSIQALASHPAIEFMGEVDDMFTLARRVAVMVVPLRIGAGTRLKILEALAWGKPLVSTSIGAEGIEFTPGEDLLVADQPELFAQTVVELLADPFQQHRLAQAGRRRVETMYTAQRSVDRLLHVLGITTPTPELPAMSARGD